MLKRATRMLSALLPLSLLLGCGAEAVSPSLMEDNGYRFVAVPVGSDTPAAGCVVCHSLERDGPLRVAPTLWGIVGADKARFQWYGYSSALARAEGDWSEEDLDRYLKDPDQYLPGTKKTLIGIGDDQQRAELIDYLKTLN